MRLGAAPIEERINLRHELCNGAWRDQEPFHGSEQDLWDAAVAGSDDRSTGCHPLDNDAAKGLGVQRRDHDDIGGMQERQNL